MKIENWETNNRHSPLECLVCTRKTYKWSKYNDDHTPHEDSYQQGTFPFLKWIEEDGGQRDIEFPWLHGEYAKETFILCHECEDELNKTVESLFEKRGKMFSRDEWVPPYHERFST